MKESDLIFVGALIVIGFLVYKNRQSATVSGGNTALDSCGCNNT